MKKDKLLILLWGGVPFCLLLSLAAGALLMLAQSPCEDIAGVYPMTEEDVAVEVVRLVNADRQTLGMEPFVLNDQLIWMAQVRSDDMIAGGYVGHFPPEGHPTLEELTEQLGYNCMKRPVEIIASVAISGERLDTVARRAVDAWRDSRGHWKWVTSEYYWMTGVGVAVDDDHVVVTQLFWGAGAPGEAIEHNREVP